MAKRQIFCKLCNKPCKSNAGLTAHVRFAHSGHGEVETVAEPIDAIPVEPEPPDEPTFPGAAEMKRVLGAMISETVDLDALLALRDVLLASVEFVRNRVLSIADKEELALRDRLAKVRDAAEKVGADQTKGEGSDALSAH